MTSKFNWILAFIMIHVYTKLRQAKCSEKKNRKKLKDGAESSTVVASVDSNDEQAIEDFKFTFSKRGLVSQGRISFGILLLGCSCFFLYYKAA